MQKLSLKQDELNSTSAKLNSELDAANGQLKSLRKQLADKDALAEVAGKVPQLEKDLAEKIEEISSLSERLANNAKESANIVADRDALRDKLAEVNQEKDALIAQHKAELEEKARILEEQQLEHAALVAGLENLSNEKGREIVGLQDELKKVTSDSQAKSEEIESLESQLFDAIAESAVFNSKY